MRRLLPLLFFSIPVCMPGQSLSPSTISSTGDVFRQGGVSLSFTVGELAVRTLSSENLMLTQGFHQPIVINVSNREIPGLDWRIKTWPNPVSSALYLQIHTDKPSDILVRVYDMSGRTHRLLKIESTKLPAPCRIDLSDLEKGLYIFSFHTPDRQLLRLVKIQKQ